MRILIVTHRYPPDSGAGVETYAARTAQLLRARGHDVAVLTAIKDVARRDLSVSRRSHDGVPVFEITNNLFAKSFEGTWSNPALERAVGPILDEVRPDVVHVHHLLYLSVGLLGTFAARGLPVLYTLHDFWLGCARFGQLLHADGARCERVDPARCGSCLPSFPWRQSDAARRVSKVLAGVKRATGVDLKGPLARRHRRSQGRAQGSAQWTEPPASEASHYASLAERRAREIVTAVNDHVARVLLPSAFQRAWFEELGVRPELLHVQPTGIDWDGAREVAHVEREPSGPVRFLFLGTLVPHKGAHVLLDAWGRLDPDVRKRATLAVFGPDDNRPDYVESLRPRATELDVLMGGRLDRKGVGRTLAASDVLIIPSLWLEVRPLVMMEAYAQGLRVIASDLGGMAEVIADGVPGATFPAGDAASLAQVIAAEVQRASGPGSSPASAGLVLPEPSETFPTWDGLADALERHSTEVASPSGTRPPGPLT